MSIMAGMSGRAKRPVGVLWEHRTGGRLGQGRLLEEAGFQWRAQMASDGSQKRCFPKGQTGAPGGVWGPHPDHSDEPGPLPPFFLSSLCALSSTDVWHLPDSMRWLAHLARVVSGARDSKMNALISLAEGCSMSQACRRGLALGLQRDPIVWLKKTVNGQVGWWSLHLGGH